MSFFTAICMLVSLLATLASASKCPSDTQLWCSNEQTAKSCNVYEQCAKFVWKAKEVRVNTAAVNLTLYYETLCPDSKRFINGQLWDAYQNVSSIMNLTLVPYGNAKETWRNETKLWQFACQHGQDECLGNLIQTCLIYYRPKSDDSFPFIHCMESNDQDDVTTAAQKCGEQLSIDLANVMKCANSRMGNTLEHQMAVLTDALQPAHTYVPWVTLNDVHTEQIEQEAESDLIGLICSTYQGASKPPACAQSKSLLNQLLI